MSGLVTSSTNSGMRQVVDWSAALWAGLFAGLAFLLINVAGIPYVDGGNSWMVVRYVASLVLGDGVLVPATANMGILAVAVIVNFVMAVAYASILAIIIHRGGLIMGIILGAIFGFALYLINMGAFTILYPWFEVLYSQVFIASHIIFGALAGAIYEALEVEEFVPIEAE